MKVLSCQYCRDEEKNIPATVSTSHVIFRTTLKDNRIIYSCTICLSENLLEYPEEISHITNMGKWSVN